MRILLILPLILFLVGCHPRPTEDLILADVAIKAAQKVKADSLSSELYRRAENHYLRAKKDYGEGYYDSCRKHAKDARIFAEQAEYQALQKQTQIKGKTLDENAPTPGN